MHWYVFYMLFSIGTLKEAIKKSNIFPPMLKIESYDHGGMDWGHIGGTELGIQKY